jgi:hypothetical protein
MPLKFSATRFEISSAGASPLRQHWNRDVHFYRTTHTTCYGDCTAEIEFRRPELWQEGLRV